MKDQTKTPDTNRSSSSTTASQACSGRAGAAPRGPQPQGPALPGRMITRQQLAAHVGLSVRMIDELTHTGVLPYFKIGKAVRYDLAEAEAAFRARYHVAAHPAQGTPGGGLGTSLPTLNPPASGSPTSSGCAVASDNTTNYHDQAAPASSSSTLNHAA